MTTQSLVPLYSVSSLERVRGQRYNRLKGVLTSGGDEAWAVSSSSLSSTSRGGLR